MNPWYNSSLPMSLESMRSLSPGAAPLVPWKRTLLGALVCFLLCGFEVPPAGASTAQLARLSWAELFDLEVVPVVTSVSRKPEKVPMIPAAVFVITSEEIRRSGATCIPELLRLVPGLNVSRINGSSWAISARGFNNRFSSTLLVLIDGRSVYSPLVSGVYWDVQDVLLEDIERIEVVRGPGGTTWGANAVNGVINIVTKSSQATDNGLLTTGFGTYGGTDIGYRFSSRKDERNAFRFFFKAFDRKPFRTPSVNRREDDFNQGRFGFRADWEPSEKRRMTLDGAVYAGGSHEYQMLHSEKPLDSYSGVFRTDVSGGHLRFEATQSLKPGEEYRLQLYFDRTYRNDVRHKELFDTVDLDFQHAFTRFERHNVVWGLGYRNVEYSLEGTRYVDFQPKSGRTSTRSFFVQDQIALVPKRLFLTLGTKIYNHPFVGTENQPSARLLWTPRDQHVFWGAFTEARRIPSIAERAEVSIREYRDPRTGKATSFQIKGNESLGSERMKAREFGYRFLPNPRHSFDIAYFRQAYSGLAQSAPEAGKGPGGAVQTGGPKNSGIEEVHGFEMFFQWKPSRNFRFSVGKTVQWQITSSTGVPENLSPRQWFVRTSWEPCRNWEFDLSFKRSNEILDSRNDANDRNFYDRRVPTYRALDARIGWRPTGSFDLSIGGTHLLEPWHREFLSQFDYIPSDIPRNYYLKATWHF